MEDEYTKAFNTYLRSGMDAKLKSLQGAGPGLGYSIPATMENRIEQRLLDNSPLRMLASVVRIATENYAVATAAGPWSDDLKYLVIPTHWLYAQPKAAQRVVDDSSLDIESWIAGTVADIFARTESNAFINGTGVDQPRGILPEAAKGRLQVIQSEVSFVRYHELLYLHQSLPEEYAKNACFLMNRSTVQSVRLIRDGNGNFIWQPGLSDGAPDTLRGVPVCIVDEMPCHAPGSTPIAIGDFRAGYQIVDQLGIHLLRDPFTEKPFVKFYMTKRVGGDVINPSAIKVLRLAS